MAGRQSCGDLGQTVFFDLQMGDFEVTAVYFQDFLMAGGMYPNFWKHWKQHIPPILTPEIYRMDTEMLLYLKDIFSTTSLWYPCSMSINVAGVHLNEF